MTTLESDIRRSIREQTWFASNHADEQLAERKIEAWQVAAMSETGTTVAVVSSARPNAKIDVVGTLPDGATIRAVWAWLPVSRRAMLITAYFTDTR